MIIKNKLFKFSSIILLTIFNISKAIGANTNDVNIKNQVKESDIISFLTRMASVLIIFGAIVFMIMLLYGGFTYLTAAGNPENEEKAKKTLIWAVIGIIIISGAFILESYFQGNLKNIFNAN